MSETKTEWVVGDKARLDGYEWGGAQGQVATVGSVSESGYPTYNHPDLPESPSRRVGWPWPSRDAGSSWNVTYIEPDEVEGEWTEVEDWSTANNDQRVRFANDKGDEVIGSVKAVYAANDNIEITIGTGHWIDLYKEEGWTLFAKPADMQSMIKTGVYKVDTSGLLVVLPNGEKVYTNIPHVGSPFPNWVDTAGFDSYITEENRIQ